MSCPYRRDAPSGLWEQSEYVKLAGYDAVTAAQPPGVFQCHQLPGGDPQGRVCAGWAGTHAGNAYDRELLALRLAAALGWMSDADLEATRGYVSPVPLFASGAQAAAHGLAELASPGPAARKLIAKHRLRGRDVRGA